MPLTLRYKAYGSSVLPGLCAIFLDKSKRIVYVLMGEHTQKFDFVWLVWQSGSARVFRPTATALGATCSGHLFLGRCGLVNVVAAPGRSGNSGHGSAASGPRGIGRLAPAREASARTTR